MILGWCHRRQLNGQDSMARCRVLLSTQQRQSILLPYPDFVTHHQRSRWTAYCMYLTDICLILKTLRMRNFYSRFVYFVASPNVSISSCTNLDLLASFRVLNSNAPFRTSRTFLRDLLTTTAKTRVVDIKEYLKRQQYKKSIQVDYWRLVVHCQYWSLKSIVVTETRKTRTLALLVRLFRMNSNWYIFFSPLILFTVPKRLSLFAHPSTRCCNVSVCNIRTFRHSSPIKAQI